MRLIWDINPLVEYLYKHDIYHNYIYNTYIVIVKLK
jgi:hypothetical protein